MSLTTQQIALIRDTAPLFNPALFYATLFRMAPAFRPMFQKEAAIQHAALEVMLEGVLRHLDTFDSIRPQLRSLGMRHATLYGVAPGMYGVVGRALLSSLGLDGQADAHAAWATLYGMISEEMKAGAPPEEV
jgi:hemoglobin-like flavoprotein